MPVPTLLCTHPSDCGSISTIASSVHCNDSNSSNDDNDSSSKSQTCTSFCSSHSAQLVIAAIPAICPPSTLTKGCCYSGSTGSHKIKQPQESQEVPFAKASLTSNALVQSPPSDSKDNMPTPNTIFSGLQSSAIIQTASATAGTGLHSSDQTSGTISHQDQLQQQHHYLHQHQYQNHHSRGHNHAHSGGPPSPDPAVMEFISKIGQIIVKARTVSPAMTFTHTPTSGVQSDTYTGAGTTSSTSAPSPQHQNLEAVLQDIELWRHNTPVHVNILHVADHVLLERWVISYTPASASQSSPMASALDTPRGARSPFNGHPSPKTKHSRATSASTATPLKDTTDLVLLLQSLYTQIRSLPLQNCLTSFDDQAKLSKADLAYSVTSAHEDIARSHQDGAFYNNSQSISDDASIIDPSEKQFNVFALSVKSALPVEFVQVASLKVINFEASHAQWGCVRVTGMYDESVGGRIAPENFQDLTAIQKKRNRRSKGSMSSYTSDLVAKAATHQYKGDRSWSSTSQPTKADTVPGNQQASAESTTTKAALLKPTDQGTFTAAVDYPTQSIQPFTSRLQDQAPQPPPPALRSEDQFHARLQSLKRNGERLLSSLSTSMIRSSSASVDSPYVEPELDNRAMNSTNQDQMTQEYKASLPPSPLSIPVPRKANIREQDVIASPPETEQEKVQGNMGFAIPRYRQYPSAQQSPPFAQQQYHLAHTPFSTSPMAQTVARRRSSRLSIVMTCNDDSPDLARSQSPTTAVEDQRDSQYSNDSEKLASKAFPRRGSLQEQKYLSLTEIHSSKPPLGQSPSRPTYVRRSSLNPSSPHGDLFGSLVGSYEESILSGRMSTLPSKPLIFTAQIGVLASQDYKDCPPKLRCPKHVQLEFPAVFYDYESSSNHHGNHHQHQPHIVHTQHHAFSHSHSHSHSQPHPSSHPHFHHSPLHHSHSSHPFLSRGSHSFGHHISTSPSNHLLGSFSSSPALGSYLSSGSNLAMSSSLGPSSLSHGPSLAHSIPSTQDDPILPYVGNLDLDNAFRGSRRFARMPGGMRIPLRGQLQVMIKNPNKTVVKVFLVPYDFMDMPAGTKTFLRQKYYSMGPGIGPVSSNPNSGGTLRYAIHLQFCSPARGYVYLYRSIRVVFANRVPDGKESLRVVLEGLGLGSRTIGDTAGANLTSSAKDSGESVNPSPKKLEERYVKMRKGEVPFCANKKKMEMTMDGDILHGPSSGLAGLGLQQSDKPFERPLGYHCQPQLDFNGEPLEGAMHDSSRMDKMRLNTGVGMNMGMSMNLNIEQSANPFCLTPSSKRVGSSGLMGSDVDRVGDSFKDQDANHTLIPQTPADASPSLSPKRVPNLGAVSVSSPLSITPHSNEAGHYFGSGGLAHKELNRILGI